MGRIGKYLSRWFSKPQPTVSEENAEQLRLDFKERYQHFKQLISANNRALERMADIETTLRGTTPFGMTFVRSACTQITVSVHRMIQSMAVLAPGLYDGLQPRFIEIRQQIQDLLQTRPRTLADAALVVMVESLDGAWRDQAGGKMANLGEIHKRIHLKIPDGFVITATAYNRFLEYSGLHDEINRLMQSADKDGTAALFDLSSRIQQSVVKAPIPPDLEGAIQTAWKTLVSRHGGGLTVALRSSSLFEDSESGSFAGQFRTELNVSREHLLDAYREVVASKYSLQALTYRLNKGYRDEDVTVAVGCMLMVDAVAGGVAYSTNPVNAKDRSIHIDATWGLPKAIVDGSSAYDSFIVSRSPELGIVSSSIGQKTDRLVCYPQEGVCRLDTTGDLADQPCLNEEQVLDIARIAIVIEQYYGRAQDIEWAVEPDGSVSVLQSRPLQMVTPGRIDEDGPPGSQPDLPESPVLLEGGVTASPGTCAGTVFKAVKSADALRFPENSILVVRQAAPHWATLIGRCAGVISEKGGIAGHLANVAREFGVPALFGCPEALESLQNEDEITLDADRRRVYAGRIELFIQSPQVESNPMAGSPIYRLLEQLSRLIIPLNLLDPSSLDFRPENCRTLHDMTRFMHEKSVSEMFSFGRDHAFPERSSKQLFYQVPMQWWVLNLDDGFAEEVAGKYVTLDQIVSEPMLAFWEGFTAIPWAGPPAIDRRGLASVLFQSTADPSLTPGLKSRYAEKNYFMISRHYCNLSSRLGYHFATLEALVSERDIENYVTFQFKGGAADGSRRLKRVQFIGDLLEQYHFRVEIRDDHLRARIENESLSAMREHLKILGYLSLHTRQIDMIMHNSTRINTLREQMTADIRRLLGESASDDMDNGF
jgi:pyruvate,water dikinase